MKKTIALIITGFALSNPVIAKEDPVLAHGQQLHNEKCMNCHNTSVYTRPDRMVSSLSALTNQVNNCMKGPAKANWTVSETNSVIEYLNSRFYKF